MLHTRRFRFISTVTLMILTLGAYAQQPPIQYFRPYDQRGVNMFETSKVDTIEFTGLKLRFGANFTQSYQNVEHSGKSRAVITSTINNVPYRGVEIVDAETGMKSGNFLFTHASTGAPYAGVKNINKAENQYGMFIDDQNRLWTNTNQLYMMSGGFPLAQANFNIDVQLADGVRVSLVSYMSSHHHNEFWVKGGFFQIDKVGFLNSPLMDNLWKNVTMRVGHMEINYGDAHFRRSDGGNTLYNPFIENNLLDAFDTEIGAELYWQKSGIISMIGLTDGEIQGSVTKPDDRKPSLYGKLGYDAQITDKLRARLTGSFYTTKSSISNNLYSGDRTGTNYLFVMDNSAATVTGNFRSGRVIPGFTDNVTAYVINPFVKFGGIEVFGTFEWAKGNTAVENGEVQYTNTTEYTFSKLQRRKFDQIALDAIYRFGNKEQFYVGGRYNKVNGEMAFNQSANQMNNPASLAGFEAIRQGTRADITVTRQAVGAGWFITRNVMFKGEYVTQEYDGFPDTNINYKGKFEGFVVQGVIGF